MEEVAASPELSRSAPSPGGARPSFQCPTCGAVQPPSPECRRCRCDLSLVTALLAHEESLRSQTLDCLAAGDYPAAVARAEQLHELAPGDASLRLLGVGQLLTGRYEAAHATCAAAVRRSSPKE